MIKTGIYGASGYTGQELLRLLLRHPGVKVAAVTSRTYKGKKVADVFPAFRNLTDLQFMDASPDETAVAQALGSFCIMICWARSFLR